MKNMSRLITAILLTALTAFGVQAAKTAKIKLTGSAYENILMTVGQTGRTEVISTFPYTFEIAKDQLPVKLRFQSENYLYFDIDVPRKPFDTTGHVYLVKVNETAMAMRAQQAAPVAVAQQQPLMGATALDHPVEGIDVTHGVNAAPVTGRRNDKTITVIIANEEYEMAAKVDNAVNDGLAFKEYCIKTLGLPGENVKYASNLSFGKMRKTINDAIELANVMNGEASLIVYYAGHGIPDNATKDAFLMPVDADGTDTQVCFSLKDLYARINNANLKQSVVFLDACFSGAQRDGEMIVAARGARLKPKEAKPEGHTIVFSATSGDQAAFSYKAEQHGLFTYFLLKKLQESKGNVKLGELAEYLRENVELESRRVNNMPQTPVVSVSANFEDSWKGKKLAQ